MKSCPHCQAQYEDDLSFCLQDGTKLTLIGTHPNSEAITDRYAIPSETKPEKAEEVTLKLRDQPVSKETITKSSMPEINKFSGAQTQVQSEPQKSRAGFFLGALAGIGLLLIVSAIGGMFWYFGGQKSNETATNTSPIANESTTEEKTLGGHSNLESGENTTSQNTNLKSEVTPKATASVKPEETKTPINPETPEIKPTAKPTIEDIARPTPKPTRERPSRPISGGVVNGKAISLPSPAYPPAAKAVNVKGAVSVQVLIDENGNVKSANAVSGHPLLRNSAERAARNARFKPTVLNGQPVRVSGVIMYNFN